MIQFFKNILSTAIGMILSLAVIAAIITGIAAIVGSEKDVIIKKESILQINLKNTKIVERISENPFDIFKSSTEFRKSIELKQVLDNIEKAKKDDNIKAIYINTSVTNAGLSQIEEIRNKLLDFKNSGKPIIAYSEMYSQLAYFLSSVSDKIYLNPRGIIEIKGFSAEVMFYKGLLEKLDIEMQIIKHGKYKSAVEPFILEKMSLSNRKQMTLILNSIAENVLDSIASQRGLSLSEIQKHANNISLESAKSCLELNYVDALLYEDQIKDSLLSISGGAKLNLISLTKYSDVKTKKEKISRNKIAIIYATGTINSGEGDETSIGSKTTAKAIKEAREDKNVKAIVFRINSGGGSALASDIIWRETMLTKRAKKPIVTSMGDYAASGGYYIACASDNIVANPTTITGSIGVFGMVPNLENFYKNKLGITIDAVNTNTSSDLGVNRPLTNYERSKIQKGVEEIYSTFITRVSEGRNMSISSVEEISQGRVWTGYDAKAIGLIDTYGGIEKAVEIAASLAKINEFRIISLPKKKDIFSKIAIQLGSESNLNNQIIEKLGFRNDLEFILNQDKFQARIPFNIDLK